MFGETTVGRIENQIFFMNSPGGRAHGLGTQALQDVLEGVEVANFKFDFGFVRHGSSAIGENGE